MQETRLFRDIEHLLRNVIALECFKIHMGFDWIGCAHLASAATVFIEAIVNQWVLEVENIAPLLAHDAAKAMLLILHNQGYLYFADE